MIKFHAVMLDETRCEFGVDIEANSRAEAIEALEDDYPESNLVQLEDEGQSRDREHRLGEYTQKCLDDPYYEIDHGHEWGD